MFNSNFLCNFNNNTNLDDDFKKYVPELWSGDDWFGLINTDFTKKFLKNELTADIDEENIYVYASSGIAFALAFVQENFTGPCLQQKYKDFLEENWPQSIAAPEKLLKDGEEINTNVSVPEFLVAAKVLLDLVSDKGYSMIIKWWQLRIIYIHQRILEEKTSGLYKEFTELSDNLLGKLSDIDQTEFQLLLLVEICQGYLLFRRPQKAESVLDKACVIAGIEMNVEGLLGVRTKFQQNPLPQLCLRIQQKSDYTVPPSSITHKNTVLPQILKLDDDVRLERIKFLNISDNETSNIPSVIQGIVLAKCGYLLQSQPKDKLASEELSPYISNLLYQDNGPLAIRLSTLLLNISQESNHKRTVERSLRQCEEVLELLSNEKYSVFEKLSFIFGSSIPPRWEVQKQLGDLMVSLGLIKSALELYLKIKSWEDVIMCYTMLELRHKAAEIIQQELDKNPTAKLYCMLGDVTDDVNYYETAWNFSKETSARAQRHWGSFFFARKEYENAIPHLRKSLDINSLQEVVWLRLGYSAIMMENWELAAQSYLKYTHLEPNGFESWNNLAKALIKLGDKKRAHKILTEALKCNFNNWKVWENFMLVSVDTGHFEDAINAYSRLTELKQRYIDLEVIDIITKAIANNTMDAQNRPSKRLQKKLCTLLGQQCASHGNEAKLWELAAAVSDSPLSKAQKLQKAYRALTQKEPSWLSAESTCLIVLNVCKDLCEDSLLAIEQHDESERSSAVSQLSSARLSVQACVKAFENHHIKYESADSLLEELKDYIQKTTEELKRRN